ncbi:MAG: GGDEF domain-containing protein [Thermoleophilaceae bacterium]|nr:GGDEF domain-containing protein [Thermoleophilaceae bacterium]
MLGWSFMAGDVFHTPGLRTAFRAEVKRSTQATAVAAGLIAIVGMPAWVGFDHLVDPEHAATFTLVRLSIEIPLIALWLSLFTSLGRRRPELVMLLILLLVEGSIAYMLANVEEAYAPYALGMSLAIYGSAFLLIWPWGYTAALIALTWTAVAAAVALAPDPLSSSAIATIAYYLGTASLIGFLGQFFRQAGAWTEFRNRIELEREHERNEALRQQLERLSREDPLTGLANRRCWDETLAREFERTRRQGSSLTVILCDLDRLKDINDRFGHAVGDQVLKATADVLGERVRASDIAARIGGDEFGILCPDTAPEDACVVAEQLRRRLEELHDGESPLPVLTLSVGVAGRESRDQSPSDLMVRADHRLYRAKGTRNAVSSGESAPVA